MYAGVRVSVCVRAQVTGGCRCARQRNVHCASTCCCCAGSGPDVADVHSKLQCQACSLHNPPGLQVSSLAPCSLPRSHAQVVDRHMPPAGGNHHSAGANTEGVGLARQQQRGDGALAWRQAGVPQPHGAVPAGSSQHAFREGIRGRGRGHMHLVRVVCRLCMLRGGEGKRGRAGATVLALAAAATRGGARLSTPRAPHAACSQHACLLLPSPVCMGALLLPPAPLASSHSTLLMASVCDPSTRCWPVSRLMLQSSQVQGLSSTHAHLAGLASTPKELQRPCTNNMAQRLPHGRRCAAWLTP